MTLGRVRGGFTLIELLVVIAIIGLLSSVVITALNTARASARDGAIRSSVRELAKLMELEYLENQSYANLNSGVDTRYDIVTVAASCTNTVTAPYFAGTYSQNAIEICKKIVELNGTAPGTGGYLMASSSAPAKKYAVKARLVSDNTQYYCVSSSGTAAEGTQTATAIVNCTNGL